MWDWLGVLIAGIIVLAVGFIMNRAFTEQIIRKIGYILIIAGGFIIAIGIILLIVMLVSSL